MDAWIIKRIHPIQLPQPVQVPLPLPEESPLPLPEKPKVKIPKRVVIFDL